MLAALLPSWLWHPLGSCTGTAHQVAACRSYNFYSGIGANFSELTICVAAMSIMLGFWHHHNCHVKGCLRLQFHPHPDHGHPVCRRHFPSEHLPGAQS